MSNDRDDLAALLRDLRTTLDELERTLNGEPDDRRPARREPPRGSDVVRFTEEYTIPTVIAILETTIQSLELLRGVLRLADPGRSLRDGSRDESDRLDAVDRRVVEGTERALDDLRRALTGTEEPTDPVARDVFREARDLTAEIESRLAEARGEGRSARRSTDERRSVVIPVDDDDGTTEGTENREGAEDTAESDAIEIDVEAELDSIREEVREESAGAESGEDADGAAGNAGDENESENGDGNENEQP
jgi:hypothetical protein